MKYIMYVGEFQPTQYGMDRFFTYTNQGRPYQFIAIKRRKLFGVDKTLIVISKNNPPLIIDSKDFNRCFIERGKTARGR